MSYISTLYIQQALDAQLQTVPGLPQWYPENVLTGQYGKVPFTRSTLQPSKSVIISLGTNKVIEQAGLYQVDLFYPTGYSYVSERGTADAVINAFLPGFLPLADGNQLIIETAWSNTALNDMGTFLMVPIRVQWVIRMPV